MTPVLAFVREIDRDDIDLLSLELGVEIPGAAFEVLAVEAPQPG